MKANPEKAYNIYLKQRQLFLKSPAFYFDCADFFFNKKQTATAIRILSNIVELELTSTPLLRVAAYRLQQENSYELAIMLFERVLKMRPEEPQSYRDLALAYEALADLTKNWNLYEKALLLLKKVTLTKWPRFAEIELMALTEYNHIVAKMKDNNSLQLEGIFKHQLQEDVRIVLSWDADNSDMDLWVIEPSNEKAYYAHNRTTIGGRVSRDFTRGYGPEVYSLRHAMAGKYQIKCKFYASRSVELSGGVTLKVDIYTHYGTDKEKHLTTTVRVQKATDVIDLGSIELE